MSLRPDPSMMFLKADGVCSFKAVNSDVNVKIIPHTRKGMMWGVCESP